MNAVILKMNLNPTIWAEFRTSGAFQLIRTSERSHFVRHSFLMQPVEPCSPAASCAIHHKSA